MASTKMLSFLNGKEEHLESITAKLKMGNHMGSGDGSKTTVGRWSMEYGRPECSMDSQHLIMGKNTSQDSTRMMKGTVRGNAFQFLTRDTTPETSNLILRTERAQSTKQAMTNWRSSQTTGWKESAMKSDGTAIENILLFLITILHHTNFIIS